MQTQCDGSGKFPETFVKDLKPWLEGQPHLAASTKLLMQFAAFMKGEAEERGVDALATVLPINQRAILEVLFFGKPVAYTVLCVTLLLFERCCRRTARICAPRWTWPR
jgi:hypothetical protein